MVYPKAIYETGEDVLLGDHVELRSWLELWLRKHSGRVIFVPGVSAFNSTMEYNGLKWVAIRYTGDTETGVLVHPDTGIMKGVKFLRRTDDDLVDTLAGYEFPDDDADNSEAEQVGPDQPPTRPEFE